MPRRDHTHRGTLRPRGDWRASWPMAKCQRDRHGDRRGRPQRDPCTSRPEWGQHNRALLPTNADNQGSGSRAARAPHILFERSQQNAISLDRGTNIATLKLFTRPAAPFEKSGAFLLSVRLGTPLSRGRQPRTWTHRSEGQADTLDTPFRARPGWAGQRPPRGAESCDTVLGGAPGTPPPTTRSVRAYLTGRCC